MFMMRVVDLLSEGGSKALNPAAQVVEKAKGSAPVEEDSIHVHRFEVNPFLMD